MKKILSFLLYISCSCYSILLAQTWTGATSTDWNTASNWVSPMAVPTAGSNVIIPNSVASNRWPVLAANTTINNFSGQPGCRIDFNGFSLTINGDYDIQGTLNNSKPNTDIVIYAPGGNTNYLRGCIVNDHFTFNHANSSTLYEAFALPNVYNGNVIFNLNGSGTVYICYDHQSTFNGNCSVNRSVAGTTYIFNAGANAIAGNLYFVNNAGGNSIFGNASFLTIINGTLNVESNSPGNPFFNMVKIKNMLPGGNVSLGNPGQVILQNDTLAANLTVDGFSSGNISDFYQNKITGNVQITERITNGGGLFFRRNVVEGSVNFTSRSTSAIYEGNAGGNTFNGPVTFDLQGTGPVFICYDAPSTFNGSLNILRTTAGPTTIFGSGTLGVAGNFSYSNLTNGGSLIGTLTASSVINGTINMNLSGQGANPDVTMFRVKNFAAGGIIQMQNTGQVYLADDTLIANIVISGYSSGNPSDFLRNKLTGNVELADRATNNGGTYFRKNEVNGTFVFTQNSVSNFYEGNNPEGNVFNGNATFSIKGGGDANFCYQGPSFYNGNLTINRTVAGLVNIFKTGTRGVSGDFNYTNNAGGISHLGTNASVSLIHGKVNISCKPTAGIPDYVMSKLKNLAAGGTVGLENCGQIFCNDDTLVANISILNYGSGNITDFIRNDFTGSFSISDRNSHTGGTFLRLNTFRGPAIFLHQSAVGFYEANGGGNIYHNNTDFQISGTGIFSIGYSAASNFKSNLTISRTVAGPTSLFSISPVMVEGNFSYTNLAGGSSELGNDLSVSSILGTCNITTGGLGNPFIFIKKFKNQTSGGVIQIANSGQVIMQNDTLLALVTIDGFSANNPSDFYQNKIQGDVHITERSTNNGGVYFRRNKYEANFLYSHQSVSNCYEAYGGGNTYMGNARYEMKGSGELFICYDSRSLFNGNLAIERTIAGNSQVFNKGVEGVGGNFSYINTAGGNSGLGDAGFYSPVQGTITIDCQFAAGNPSFTMHKFKNMQAGGSIHIQAPCVMVFADDTLVLNEFVISGFKGSNPTDFLRNDISGNCVWTEGASNTGGTYSRGNIFRDNFVFNQLSPSTFYESYALENIYLADARFNRQGGIINLAYNKATNFYRSLYIESGSGVNVMQPIFFKGNQDAVMEQTGTQALVVNTLVMEKTAGAKLQLMDSLSVLNTVTFSNGIIFTGDGKELIFLNGATSTGASDSSHVAGPVSKIGNQAFVFPIGDSMGLQTAAISAPVGVTQRFRATYVGAAPHPLYDTSARESALKNVCGNQFWIIQRVVGNSMVKVTLEYGKPKGIPIAMTQADLRVARWNGTLWTNLGNGGVTGSLLEGTVISSGTVNDFSPFTIAAAAPYNAVTIQQGAQTVCTNTILPVNFQVTGIYNTGNVFTAQLSNASGSFANPLAIGSLVAAPGGTQVGLLMNTYLPSHLIPSGTGYLIRIVSSNPSYIGSNSPAGITMNSLYMGPDTTVLMNCPSSTVNLTSVYNTTGLTATWNTPAPTHAGAGNYRLDVLNNLGCRDTAYALVRLDVSTWLGTESSNWNDAANWSNQKVPGAKTHIIIPGGTAYGCVINAGHLQVASVQLKNGGTLTAINGATLMINGKCASLPVQ